MRRISPSTPFDPPTRWRSSGGGPQRGMKLKGIRQLYVRIGRKVASASRYLLLPPTPFKGEIWAPVRRTGAHLMRQSSTPSKELSPVWVPLSFPTLLLLMTCLACQQRPAPEPKLEAAGGPDYASVQARARQRDEEAAQAYRREHADDLPTTAEEVIARHLDAVGGREAFDTIRTLVMRFTAQGTSGEIGELTRYYMKPLHYRQKMSISPRAAVTDGDRFWWVGPDGWDADESEVGYLPLVSMDNHLIDPGALGIVHELVGVTAMDGDPGFHVRRIWPDGRDELLFFSAVSGLLTAIRSEYPLMAESWFSYWDYRDLGGVRIPFVLIRSIGELGPPHGLVLRSVEINVPLPDSLFIPPEERQW